MASVKCNMLYPLCVICSLRWHTLLRVGSISNLVVMGPEGGVPVQTKTKSNPLQSEATNTSIGCCKQAGPLGQRQCRTDSTGLSSAEVVRQHLLLRPHELYVTCTVLHGISHVMAHGLHRHMSCIGTSANLVDLHLRTMLDNKHH